MRRHLIPVLLVVLLVSPPALLLSPTAEAQTDGGDSWGQPPPEEAPAAEAEEGGNTWGEPPPEEAPPGSTPPEEADGEGDSEGSGTEETPVDQRSDWTRPAPSPAPEPAPEAAPETAPETEATEPIELEEPEERRHEFGFGSYGRVGIGTDFEGSTARPVSVVSHGPRVVELPYLEIDFYYTLNAPGPYVLRTVSTLAFTEDLFHYTGDFSSILSLRNLYAEFVYDDMISVWAGSRMYRGDDMYLLDYWPLDNLNTVGGGVGFRRGAFDIDFHMGVNRLQDEYSYQEVNVPGRLFGAERIVLMDRQRLITSLGTSYRFGGDGGPALKIKAYFEFHYLSSGSLRREDQTDENLPSDLGWTGGLQLGTWGWGDRLSHANLFLRFSQGLAAYGEMGIPFGVNDEKRAFPNASEFVLGASANWERGRFGLMGATYLRRFVDADVNEYDEDDGWEFVIDLRPWIVLFGPLQFALDLSYQQRFPSGMSPSALELLNPSIFQLAPMLIFAPLGPGSYERPQIRLVYRFAYLNEGALDTYSYEDPRHHDSTVHYIGLQAEWWFNSSYR